MLVWECPRPFDLGVQKYSWKGRVGNGGLAFFVLCRFAGKPEMGAAVSNQPVSQPGGIEKNLDLGVFFEEKGEVGAVLAGAAGLVLVEKLA